MYDITDRFIESNTIRRHLSRNVEVSPSHMFALVKHFLCQVKASILNKGNSIVQRLEWNYDKIILWTVVQNYDYVMNKKYPSINLLLNICF